LKQKEEAAPTQGWICFPLKKSLRKDGEEERPRPGVGRFSMPSGARHLQGSKAQGYNKGLVARKAKEKGINTSRGMRESHSML